MKQARVGTVICLGIVTDAMYQAGAPNARAPIASVAFQIGPFG